MSRGKLGSSTGRYRAVLGQRRALLGLGVGCALLPWLADSLSLRGATAQRSLGDAVGLTRALSDSTLGVALTWIAEHPPRELAWNWGEGVLAFGVECAFHATRDERLRTYLREYLRHHRTQGVRVTWSDQATPGLVATALAQQGEAEFGPLAEQVVHYALGAPRTRSGMLRHLGTAYPDAIQRLFPDAWIDSVFHVVPTLMRYAAWKRDRRALAEGTRQLVLFSRALTDPVTGLVTHACNDGATLEPVPAFARRAFWARGNGWMLATVVDAFAFLPADHPDRDELLSFARRLETRLGQTQASSGFFHTLLLDQDSYQETAGSALILFGMARGVRLGLFGDDTLARVVRGARGLWQVVRRAGERELVTGTSLGTNPVEPLYRWTPTAEQVSYGVGAWLLAASETVRLLEPAPGIDA
jgi:rhamnogalacturonyl hydrolase YesR